MGRMADADETLRALIAAFGTTKPLRVAEVYAYRGDRDEAFKWLEAVSRLPLERRPDEGRFSPFLEPLHTDPRWNRWTASVLTSIF
jgi:hypothetical protein